MSRTPGTLRHGHRPRDVISVESSNNATVGPALIPLLTMGIPGSPTAAVLLGGLLIHGLFPGPELFTKHADVAYTFIASMVVAQFAMADLRDHAISRYSHVVMNIPNIFMVAAVTILCVYGSYSVQNSMDDVIIMFCLGLSHVPEQPQRLLSRPPSCSGSSWAPWPRTTSAGARSSPRPATGWPATS